ncbi:cationic amino acid transporter, putative [Bodo saltans]|uniref:Cationic amino acid transporter, putative n=1 Tax=Bodo saltans TaxID=75058 RepID=A0A0S4J8G5_BODSA|nr:cationic amino acid transporter, putative [Bodo saltans]|eukprot:CUG86393.1 cationic amino acid transporter, putative [Bodo saltans]
MEPHKALSLMQELLRKKDIHHLADVVKDSKLHRTLDLMHLVSLGIGCVVGAGIFVITGQAAALYAGPALTISFALCALPCIFTGLCYGELASMIPIAGSAYSFSGLALGEIVSWFVAMCLTLENLVASSAVAVGWSASVQALLSEFDIYIPTLVASSPLIVDGGDFITTGAIINVPAVLIIVVLAALLCAGVQESARFNNIAVAIKITVLLTFVAYGAYYARNHDAEFNANLTPYIPPNEGSFGQFGWSGIFRGAGVVFFANVGFDSICSTAQECINPQRDLPLGLMITVVVCTTLYIAVTTVLTGMVPYELLNVDAPVLEALVHVGAAQFFRIFVAIGAIAGLTSVCLVSLMSMPRLLLTVAQDGLLPPLMAHVLGSCFCGHGRSIAAGTVSALIAGLLPLTMLGELVSFGTLVAFIVVCVSAWRLRITHPEQPRAFRAPLFPWVPIAGVSVCSIQLLSLPLATWRNYAICSVIATIVYFTYSRKHSKLATDEEIFERAQSEGLCSPKVLADAAVEEMAPEMKTEEERLSLPLEEEELRAV